ncbi:MAG TPA: heptaprenyl diphosphate synthase component II [Pseudogracilibacillus sp.]|nr:heptaprenyl diphosphate synthase component II [Pseudogracilibacillus sp.]
MKLSHIYGYLKKDMKDIDERLADSIEAEHTVLRDASMHLLQAGGKRIRPVFVLLAASFGDEKTYEEDIKAVAVALELIHMATLVHDDVVDDASLRRGEATIKSLYGNRVAMYTGDYMLARALEVITTVQNPRIHQILSKTLVKVVEGEISQIKEKFNVNQSLKDYLHRIKRKTALLIATSCELGAVAAGASTKDAKRLYRYGYHVGMSFQIIDDLLDFTASTEQLGKPAGSDLMQGNITLPILFAMEDDTFKGILEETFRTYDVIDETAIAPLLLKLHQSDAVERSYQLSNRYLEKSLNDIQMLHDHSSKKTLQMIAAFIGKRRS